MKIVFNKLQTSKETIQVSLDGGTTWNPYVVSEIIETGIPLDENQEYDKIQIKGSSTVLKNLDVVKSIEIPESSNEIFTHDGTGFYEDLVNVKIPEGFTHIGPRAFYECRRLTNIDLPESLASINLGAFGSCTRLTSIDLPESLKSVGGNAFGDCTSLTSIIIPDNVTYIGGSAFYGCKNLTSVVLPEGLTYLDAYAFGDCTSLKTINFKGTEDQWNAIEKSSSWNNNCPSDMQIVYNYQGE